MLAHRFVLTPATFERKGPMWSDPCDLRSYCCNPVETSTIDLLDVDALNKYELPCGPCFVKCALAPARRFQSCKSPVVCIVRHTPFGQV